jgi:hypothetical protein
MFPGSDDGPSGTFDIACPECAFSRTASSASEAVEWMEKHENHTAHDCNCTPPEAFADDTTGEYVVECSTCGFARRLEDKTYAHAFATDHALVTDHPRPPIREVAGSQCDAADQKSTVSDLEKAIHLEHTEAYRQMVKIKRLEREKKKIFEEGHSSENEDRLEEINERLIQLQM